MQIAFFTPNNATFSFATLTPRGYTITPLKVLPGRDTLFFDHEMVDGIHWEAIAGIETVAVCDHAFDTHELEDFVLQFMELFFEMRNLALVECGGYERSVRVPLKLRRMNDIELVSRKWIERATRDIKPDSSVKRWDQFRELIMEAFTKMGQVVEVELMAFTLT